MMNCSKFIEIHDARIQKRNNSGNQNGVNESILRIVEYIWAKSNFWKNKLHEIFRLISAVSVLKRCLTRLSSSRDPQLQFPFERWTHSWWYDTRSLACWSRAQQMRDFHQNCLLSILCVNFCRILMNSWTFS